jgi:hypothetical protein
MLYPVALTVLFYALYYLAQFLYRELTYPLRNVTGPKNPSFIFGSFKEMRVTSNSEPIVIIVLNSCQNDVNLAEQWRDEFGPTFMFRSMFSVCESF